MSFSTIGIKDKKATLEIISAEGRIVLEKDQITNSKSIDISRIPAGVYFMQLEFSDRVVTKRFIKL